MAKLVFHSDRIKDSAAFRALCPFGAIEEAGGVFTPGAGCRMCGLCVKKSANGEAEFVEEEKKGIDKSLWHDVCVWAEQTPKGLHPVTLELVGKAKELAAVTGEKVKCILAGASVESLARELLHYGVDEVHLFEAPELAHFAIEPFTAVMEAFIRREMPCAILVGATPVGRLLAPRVAARFRTGLTADCTKLEMLENGDLQQIRPAFGGNIMAHIHTPDSRPQLATVRYKVMDAPARCEAEQGKIVRQNMAGIDLSSRIKVLSVEEKPEKPGIEDAEVLIVAGRGVRKKEDIAMLKELANRLGGKLACTRPMAESGMMAPRCQIGLSGRTVRPKLIMTFGVSGAVQFTSGMNKSDVIFAVNTDEKAPIFKLAHYGVVGDLYKIVPLLLEALGK